MPRYYMPGERKGNRTVVVRGHIDGRQYEIRTRTIHKTPAKAEWKEHVRKVRECRPVDDAQAGSLKAVAQLYKKVRRHRPYWGQRIDKLLACKLVVDGEIKALGELHVADITQVHADAAAQTLYPTAKASTRNTAVYQPLSALLHYAADARLCPHPRLHHLKVERPELRRPKAGVYSLLLANTSGEKRAAIILLAHQGWRVSELVRLRWEDVDFREGTLRAIVTKSKTWKIVPMFEETRQALMALGRREGKVFSWRTPQAVRRWINKLDRRLGVKFTPHMARHEFASWLLEKNVPEKGIMAAGTWTSAKSVSRYANPDMEYARRVIDLTRGITGASEPKPLKDKETA